MAQVKEQSTPALAPPTQAEPFGGIQLRGFKNYQPYVSVSYPICLRTRVTSKLGCSAILASRRARRKVEMKSDPEAPISPHGASSNYRVFA